MQAKDSSPAPLTAPGTVIKILRLPVNVYFNVNLITLAKKSKRADARFMQKYFDIPYVV
jgi:hypothetical protein